MIFEVAKDFPKDYKYTLGQDMKRDALQLVRNIYCANRSAPKKEHLENFLDEFELLKLEIRLCVNMKVMPFKKQAVLTLLIHSIGKQVTGWHYASQLNAGIAVVMVTASEHAFFKRDKGIVLAQLSNRNARHLALIKTPL